MEYTIELPKVDYNNTGKKINAVTIEVALKDNGKPSWHKDYKPVFTVSGCVWNAKKTDCLKAGQCIDDIADFYPKDKRVQRIWQVWQEYHLNDKQAGTPAQTALLERHKDEYKDYESACAILERYGLLEDNGYKYGSAWLYKSIPLNVIKEIENQFK